MLLWENKADSEGKGITRQQMLTQVPWVQSMGTNINHKYYPVIYQNFFLKGTTWLNEAQTMVHCNLTKMHSFFKQRKVSRQIH